MTRLFAAMVLALAAAGASALDLVVGNLADGGSGSLRDAIAQANASADPTATITFGQGVTGTLTLTSGPLAITRGGVTVAGPGRFNLTIDGNAASPIFRMTAGPSSTRCSAAPSVGDAPVTLRDMMITNGRATDGLPGGAIYTELTLSLAGVTVGKSTANQGGGIAVYPRFANQGAGIDNSWIVNNTATATGGDPGFANSGGGIWVGSPCALNSPPGLVSLPKFILALSNSEVLGNSVLPGSGSHWGLGGGIAMFGNGDLGVTDTRISGNGIVQPATGPASNVYFGGNVFVLGGNGAVFQRTEISRGMALKGAGLDFEQWIPLGQTLPLFVVNVVNSTIGENVASGNGANGGAISAFGNVQVLTFNSTIYANQAPPGAVAGVYFDTTNGVPRPSGQFVSTIDWSDGTSFDVGASLTAIGPYTFSASHSLLGNVPSNATPSGIGNIFGSNPMLTSLGYNGTSGSTRTYAVQPGSPVIGAGSNPLNLENDQRGPPWARSVAERVNIGSFEGVVHKSLQGLFWGTPPKSLNGEGFFLNQQGAQGESMFGAGYLFATNKPLWLVFAGMRAGDGTFSGDAFTATGPSFDKFNPGTASQVSPLKAGTFQLTPGDSGDFKLTFNLNFTLPQEARSGRPQAKAVLSVTKTLGLTGQTFGYPVPTCGPATPAQQVAATNYQDIWWASPAGSESGWGLTIAHQGDTLFVAWFTYGPDGNALWFVFALTEAGPNTYTGNVYTATGPSFDAAVYDPSTVAGTQVGTATLTFTDGANGTFAYTVNGISQSKAITREVFGGVGNVCN